MDIGSFSKQFRDVYRRVTIIKQTSSIETSKVKIFSSANKGTACSRLLVK